MFRNLKSEISNRKLVGRRPGAPGRAACPTLLAACCFIAALLAGTLGEVSAQDAQWIWTPDHKKDAVPQGSCHFRKSFVLGGTPESGQITIAADDTYELFVNGRRVAEGEVPRRLDKHDVSEYLTKGRNLIAVKVTNRTGPTAALAARVSVKERGNDWASHSSDGSWKCSVRPLPLWHVPVYNDTRWGASQALGPLGATAPWDRRPEVAAQEQQNHERFTISPSFNVQKVVDHEAAGSLIAMSFNEFGQIIASREKGPLLLITDSNKDKIPDQVKTYCDKVKNCQGILALNGEVFVTADGPEGAALYKLKDRDRDGKLEEAKAILKFKGEMGEHGIHGLTLGPDGMIYVMVGNHTSPERDYDAASPFRDAYEGDLVVPRYEDPGGHAVGVKAPGGVILRTDAEGNALQLVAGGLRNAYDLVFNREGELFAHDSDMEADEATPWYSPTQVFHVTPGAEFGWRSGWSRFPEYFVDNVTGILDSGRGSPTGATVYDHHMFPARFHQALFLADWSEGRILAVSLKRSGATYTASSEVFLQGEPLNVTDLEVGPDGCLYFITGGRGTNGGLYRICWKGTVPDAEKNLGEGISAAIRQPQLGSAWARQNVAGIKEQLGARWDKSLAGIAQNAANPPHYRTRALDLMQLLGPVPTSELLIALAKDKSEQVRGKAADLMGLHPADETRGALVKLLDDADRNVRRKSLEAFARAEQEAPVEKIFKSLASDDRAEAWAARRLLERMRLDRWREAALAAKEQRVFIQGALALMIAQPSGENAEAVLTRARAMMGEFISDRNFVDLLRIMQVALLRGEIVPDRATELRDLLAEEYPSGDALINRELVRLLVYLQCGETTDRYLAFLKSDAPPIEKLHLALHLRFLKEGWKEGQKLELLKFYENAQKQKGGSSYPHYVVNVTRDFGKTLSEEESRQVLAKGAEWPNAALGALYKVPAQIDADTLTALKDLDRKLAGRTGDTVHRLKVGIVAVLARSADEDSFAYLRDIWENDPERRGAVAMGLAQSPEGENWRYLIKSLPVLEGKAGQEVLAKLRTVEQAPEEAEHYRQVILRGLVLKDQGAQQAIELLEFWTGEKRQPEGDGWEKKLAAWQAWFAETYPDKPEAVLPTPPTDNKWQLAELLQYLNGEEGAKGKADLGAAVYQKAQCNKCHRFGDSGEPLGPDLTSVSKRFTKREILEAILFPSHVISDQYASKTLITKGGLKYTGIVSTGGAGETIVLQENAKKLVLDTDEIESMAPSKISSMPAGLLNPLTQQEIADLFAYLGATPKEVASRPKVIAAPK
jgi:putative heme-binding domain-containing protein